MAAPVRIFFFVNQILIDTIPTPFVAGSLIATMSGANVEIRRTQSSFLFTSIPWAQVADVDGNTFGSSVDVMAYLAVQFALPSVTGIYQDPRVIVTQNVIPPLSKPWRASLGAFANIVAGAATLTHGGGVVTFTDGSTVVTFDPQEAGFNLDPTETVLAQYSA